MADIARTLPGAFSDDRDAVPLIVRHFGSHTEAAPRGLRLRLGVKRAIDLVLAIIGLLIVSPVMLLVALLVRLTSPGPAFFRQSRIGVGGRAFEIVKFRTMVQDAEGILAEDDALRQLYLTNNFKVPVQQDPRVTAVGGFLRRCSLDELPQLWNVLRGDMSLVGARPIEESQVQVLYGDRKNFYLAMRPGLTGHWQVSGRSNVGDDDRAELDVHYLRNWSLRLDAWIIIKTLPAVLRRHGAY